MAGKGGRGLQIMVALLPSYELIFLQHICLCVIKMFSFIKRWYDLEFAFDWYNLTSIRETRKEDQGKIVLKHNIN